MQETAAKRMGRSPARQSDRKGQVMEKVLKCTAGVVGCLVCKTDNRSATSASKNVERRGVNSKGLPVWLVVALVSFFLIRVALGTAYTWTDQATAGNWSSTSLTADWKSATYPNATTDTVSYVGTVNNPTITLDVGVVINSLSVSQTRGITVAKSGANTLAFGGTNPQIVNNNANANCYITINPDIVLQANLLVSSVNSGGNAQITIAGGITGTANLTVKNTKNKPITFSGLINNTGAFATDSTSSGGYGLSLSGGIGSNVTTVLLQTPNCTGTLSAVSYYTGDLTITNGAVLKQGGTSVLAYGPNKANVNINGGASLAGALDLAGFDVQINGLNGNVSGVSGSIYNSLASSVKTLTLGNNNATAIFGGSLKDNAGTGGTLQLVKTGSGTQTLNGVSTYTGKTTVNGGVLAINAETGIGGNPAVLTGDQLKLDGGALQTTASFAIDDSNRGITLGANGGTLSPDIGTTLSVSNVIAGTSGGALNKMGAGTLVLAAANTYNGATRIGGGSLTLAVAADRLPTTTTVTVENVAGAMLDLNGVNQTIAALVGGGSAGGSVSLGTATLTVGDASSTTFTGTISGATGNLTKQGSGVLTLAGTNSYGGTTTINNGTLRYGTNDVLANASFVTVAGGTLDIAGFTDTVAGVQLASGSITGSSGILTSTSAFDLRSGSVSANLGGSVGVNKSSASPVTLSGANTYTGPTIISNGTLSISAGGSIANSSQIDVQSGAVLDVTAAGIALSAGQTLKGRGTVNGTVTNNGTLSPGASIGTLTINGNLTLNAGSTNVFELSATNDLDRLVVITNITYGGTLTITTNTGAALAAGVYDLFDFTGSYGGTFAVTNLPVVNGMEWQAFNYASGSIELKVLSGTQPPTVVSPTVTAIGTTSATLGGTLSYDGGETCTYGTSWDSVPTGSNSNPQTCLTPTNAFGAFSQTIGAFSAGGHYYAWAWASNSAAKVFTTSSYEFYTEPLQVSGLAISSATTNSLTVSWVADNSSSGTLVVVKQGGAGADAAPVDGSNYTASAVFGTAGASMGNGCYAVYGGSGTQVVVSGLSLGTTYSVAAYAYAGSGAGLINYQQFGPATNSARTMFALPVVTTPVVTNLLSSTARLMATVSSDGGGVSGWGVRWGSAPSPSDHSVTNTGTYSAPFGFTNDLSGLTPGQEYYALAWASNGDYQVQSSSDAHFYTEPLAASNVTFSSLTSTGMTVQWQGSGTGAVVLMAQGVAPNTTPVDGSNYTYSADYSSAPNLGTGKVVYAGSASSVAVSGLTRTSTYYVAVYEYAGTGGLVNYQQIGPATGSQATPAVLPTLTTPVVSGINTTNALTGATLVDNGGATISSWGTTWSTSATGTNDNPLAGSGTTNGTFTLMRTGLPSGASLYVWGWASNSVGVAYTPTSTNFFTEPLPASNVVFGSVTTNSMAISWAAGNGGRRIVVLKRGGPVTNAPVDGVDYADDSMFGNGSNLGGREYVVFNGSGTNVLVTGLTRSVYFHAAVFEYAGDTNVALRNYQQDAPATNSQQMTVVPASFIYDGADNADMDWDNPTNYIGDAGFPDGAGDVLIVSNSVPAHEANAYKMNGSRTLGSFLKNFGGGGHNTGITGGSDPTSVLTWDTGQVGSDAALTVRGASSAGAELRCYTTVGMVLNSSLVWDGSTTRRFADDANGEIKGTVSGSGRLTLKWNACKYDLETLPMQFELRGSNPNTHAGGTVFACNRLDTQQPNPVGRAGFRLNKQWATGLGHTIVTTNAEIYIPTNNWAGGAIHDNTYLYLEHAGSSYGKVDLEGSSVTETVARLYFDGVQQAAGSYGNTGSGANYELASWFAGTGKLVVTQGPLVVTNLSVTAIGTNQATLGCEVLGVGQTVLARGTAYGSSASPTSNALSDGGAATGVVTQVRNGLSAGGHYYYRGWASNATDGIVYSAYDGEFYAEPQAASGVTIDTVTSTSFRVTWNAGTGSSGTVVMVKAGTAVDALPSDGSNYTANASFGAGEQVGAGSYVVYANSGSQVTVTNLIPGTTYHVAVFAYAGSSSLINYQTNGVAGSVANSRTLYLVPTLGTPSAPFAGITSDSATLNATVLTDGNGAVLQWGTLWATTPTPRINALTHTGTTNAPFDISDARSAEFTPGMRYYYCGWASNLDWVAYSADGQFYTEPLALSGLALTSAATSIEVAWVTNGTAAQGAVVLLRLGAAISDEPADGTNYDGVANANYFAAGDLGNSKVVFSGAGTNVTITSLPAGQTYYIKVFPYAGSSTLRNHRQSTPLADSVTLSASGAPPTLSSPTAEGIGTTNALLGATVETNNSSAITLWGTAFDALPPGQANLLAGGTDDRAGSFSMAREDLVPGAHYYACGWASNSFGVGFSPATEFFAEPLPVLGLGVDSVTTNSFHIHWTADASSSGTVVLVKAGLAVDATPADGSNYTDQATFGGGTQLGSSNYVVYVGAGTQVTVTALMPGTTYGVAAFAYAGSGALIQYREETAPATSQRALWFAPTLGASSVMITNITTNSATLMAAVVDGGGTNLVRWGTLWGSTPAPAGNAYTNSGSTNAPFTIADLRAGEFSPGQHYYFRGWADNGDAVGYSADGEFYTEPLSPANVQIGGVLSTQLNLSWSTNATMGGTLVLMKRGGAVDADPVDGATYAASNVFASGSQIGTGNYVVYAGNGTNVTVTGIPFAAGQACYVKVYGYAGAGGLINYQETAPTASTNLPGGGTWISVAATGNWSDTSNWTNGIVADGSGNTADFNTRDLTTDVTVHLDTARTIGNLVFGDTDTNSLGNWIVDNSGVTNNVLTLAGGTPTITVNTMGAGKNATISAALSGAGGITKAGGGTLILTGTNTYAGTTTISTGFLRAAYGVGITTGNFVMLPGGVYQATANMTKTNGITTPTTTAIGWGLTAYSPTVGTTVTLDWGNNNYTPGNPASVITLNGADATGPLVFKGNVVSVNRHHIAVNSTNYSATMTGLWSCGTTVTTGHGKVGAGHLILQGGASMTGAGVPFCVFEGALTFDSSSFVGLDGLTVGKAFNSGTQAATLNVNGTSVIQTGLGKGIDIGTGSAPGNSDGIVNVSSGGTLYVSRIRKGSSNGTIYFDNGSVKVLDSTNVASFMTGLSGAYIKAGGVTFDSNGFDPVVGQNLLTDTNSLGGGLTKRGTGSLTLTATNTYTGGTVVEAGTLVPNVNNALGTGDVTVVAGGTLQLNDRGATDNMVADSASVRLASSAGIYGRLSLQDGVTEAVSNLYLDGVIQLKGTYGSTNAGTVARYKLSGWFDGSASGVLNVLDGPTRGSIFTFH